MAQGRDSFRAEEVQLKEHLEAVEKTSNPIAIARALLEVSDSRPENRKNKAAMEGFDRINELLHEIKKPDCRQYVHLGRFARDYDRVHEPSQRDCLILQGQTEAAREKSRLRNEMVKVRESLKLS